MAITASYSGKRLLPWIGLSGLGMGLLVWRVWQWLQPTGPEAWLSPAFVTGLLLTAFLVGISVFLSRWLSRIDFFSVEELLSTALLAGLGALTVAVVPDAVIWLGGVWQPTAWLEALYHAITVTWTVAFFVGVGILFMRLIRSHGAKRSDQVFKVLAGILLVGCVFNFYEANLPSLLFAIVLIAGGAAGLYLITQMGWIAHLTGRSRLWSMLYLLGILVLSLGLIQKMIDFRLSEAFHLYYLRNPFLLLTSSFVTVFSGMGFLSLLFHLPIARVWDARQKEVSAFQTVAQSAFEQGDASELHRIVLDTCVESSEADGGWIARVDKRNPGDEALAYIGIDPKDSKRVEYCLHSHPEHYRTGAEDQFLYIRDLEQDPYLKFHGLPYRSLVFFPIRLKKSGLHKLFLVHERPNGFDAYTIQRLRTLINQSQLTLEHQTLLRESVTSEQLKRDVELGRQVQQRLLAFEYPQIKSLDIGSASLPAEEIGGDYFDLVPFSDNRVGVIMADVSGKGTSAAFHVAEMKGIFQSLMLSELDPATFVSKANLAVGRCFDKGMFITLVYGLIDQKEETFTYVRAGHTPVLVYDGTSREWHFPKDEGLGLGIIRDTEYNEHIQQQSIPFRSGDAIVMFTDGITETRDPGKEDEFGFERLRDSLYLHIDHPARQVANKVIQDVLEYAEASTGRDDMSVLVLKKTSAKH